MTGNGGLMSRILPVLGTFFLALAAEAAPTSRADEVRRLAADGRVADAKSMLLDCAERDNNECQYLLAVWLEGGQNIERDLARARAMYEAAYRNGNQAASEDILRLAKSDASASSTVRGNYADAVKNVGDAQVPATAAVPSAHLTFDERGWDVAKQETWMSRSPSLFGIRLGDQDSEAFRLLQDIECEKAELFVERECSAYLSFEGSQIGVFISFFGARVRGIVAFINGASTCKRVEEYANSALGKSSRRTRVKEVSESVHALIRENDWQKARIRYWSRDDEWAAAYVGTRSLESCVFVFGTEKGFKQ
jgi:hypothetical protein